MLVKLIPRYQYDRIVSLYFRKLFEKFLNIFKILSSQSQLIVRGENDGGFMAEHKLIKQRLDKVLSHVKWNPHPFDIKIAKNEAFKEYPMDRSLTLCSNRNSIIEPLEHIIDQARAKYDAKAYLHWYHRYGLEDSLFEQSFETMETVVQNYKDWY